jgi:hypothetical protein
MTSTNAVAPRGTSDAESPQVIRRFIGVIDNYFATARAGGCMMPLARIWENGANPPVYRGTPEAALLTRIHSIQPQLSARFAEIMDLAPKVAEAVKDRGEVEQVFLFLGHLKRLSPAQAFEKWALVEARLQVVLHRPQSTDVSRNSEQPAAMIGEMEDATKLRKANCYMQIEAVRNANKNKSKDTIEALNTPGCKQLRDEMDDLGLNDVKMAVEAARMHCRRRVQK